MAKLSQLLLFDPDPSGLETLTYAFGKDGIAVTGMGDARKARELLETTSASLVLVSLHDPEQGGLDLIRAAVNTPRTRNIPCLALGPEKLRAAALTAGAFGFLPSPLFVRDVIDAAKLAAAATVPGSRPSPDTEVSIGLGEIGGVYFLIRALAASGRSAAVEIQGRGRRGELRFLDGNLSSVQLGSLSGMAALTHLLLWQEADLRLKFRNVVRRGGQISLKNEEIIEQCDRFLRDFAHEVRDMGSARTIYRPSDRSVQPTSALPSEVVPLLRLFDGQRDLAQILDESPFRTFDTLRIARQFMMAGAVVTDPPYKATPLNEAPIANGPAALDAWFERKGPTTTAAEHATSAPASPAAPSGPTDRAPGLRQPDARGTGVPSPIGRPAAGPSSQPVHGPARATSSGTAPARSPTMPLTQGRGYGQGHGPGKDRRSSTVTQKQHSGRVAAAAVRPNVGVDPMKTPPPVTVTAPLPSPLTATAAAPHISSPPTAAGTLAASPSAAAATDATRTTPVTPAPASARPAPIVAPAVQPPTADATSSAPPGSPEPITPRPTRSSGAFARGEIHVTPVSPRAAVTAPAPATPTVLVEPEVMPTPKPVVTVAPEALAARPSPRDLPGPATPPPVTVSSSSAGVPRARTPVPSPVTPPSRPRIPTPAPQTSPLSEADVVTPPPLPVAAAAPPPSPGPPPPSTGAEPGAPSVTPPSASQTPPPPLATPAPSPGGAVPIPTTVTGRKGAVPSPHRSRTPSNGFSAVEADFFNREADLYKPAETFDDLDASTSSPDLVPGKRGPASKT